MLSEEFSETYPYTLGAATIIYIIYKLYLVPQPKRNNDKF